MTSLRHELQPTLDIWVSTVEPGFNRTGFLTNCCKPDQIKAKYEKIPLSMRKNLEKIYDIGKWVGINKSNDELFDTFLIRNFLINDDSMKIVNCVEMGLCSKWPRHSYFPTWGAWALVRAYQVVPYAVSDMVIGGVFDTDIVKS